MTPKSNAIARTELGATFNEFDLFLNQRNFIGHRVLRPRTVSKNAADVGKVPLKELLQSRSTKRASGAGYARDNFEFDKYTYSVSEYGKEEPLDDGQLAIYGDVIDAETVVAARAVDAVLNEYERDVAAAVFNTSTWTGATLTTAASTAWTSHSSATPLKDVSDACEKVSLSSGIEANALVISKSLCRELLQTQEIVDRVKYTATATPGFILNALADFFSLKYIIVAGGLKNSANEGQAASLARIWSGTMAMVCRVAETPDPRETCIGRTFMWDGDGPAAPGDGGPISVLVEQYREEGVRGDIYRARNNRDIQIMYKEAGHLITGLAS